MVKNINPIVAKNIMATSDDKQKAIFLRGLYAVGKLDNINTLIISGKISPRDYAKKYAPRIFNFRKYIYELINLLETTRNFELMYIKQDARDTLREFDEVVNKFISTENTKDSFIFGR